MRMKPKVVFISLLSVFGIIVVTTCIYVYIVVDGNLPSIDRLENPRPELASTVLSADGEVLEQFFFERRRYISIDSIPESFINALVATEDREFYNHWGVHVMRIFKATVKNIMAGDLRGEGASTITQQLARNLFDDRAPTLARKLREAFTAIKIEQRYTKREILELYANTVYYGMGAHGLQVASQLFFNKSPMEMTVAESAYLVALLKSPVGYDARFHYDNAIRRRNLVLRSMKAGGVLSQAQFETACAEDITLVAPEERSLIGVDIAPNFVEIIRQKLTDKETRRSFNLERNGEAYDLHRDGLVIYTTLNAQMQRYANEAAQEHLKGFQKQFDRFWRWSNNKKLLDEYVDRHIKATDDYQKSKTKDEKKALLKKLQSDTAVIRAAKRKATKVEIGFVAMEPATGEVRAMVGSSTFGKDARYVLNHVTQIKRQPGSAFKPFLYATVLQEGLLTSDSLVDVHAFTYTMPDGQVWELEGWRGDTTGPRTLKTALKYSINPAAARLITHYTTPSDVVDVARRMGIKSKLAPYPSLALGSEVVSPLELTAAFTGFQNGGVSTEPYFITRIEDRHGNIIYDRKGAIHGKDAIATEVAEEMVQMMRGVINGGSAARVRTWFPYEAAGKTGTTNDFADAWFVGFTPHLIGGVWAGFDDIRVKFTDTYGYGGRAAAPIWGRFMEKVYKDPLLGYDPKESFPKPVVDEPSTADNNADVQPEPQLNAAAVTNNGERRAQPLRSLTKKKADSGRTRVIRPLRELSETAAADNSDSLTKRRAQALPDQP